jgi:two-component system chemotaxis response regulator CheB
MASKIRVLVVDDSALIREVLRQGLSADEAIEVVDTASDPFNARDKIVALRPDVITLDVEMPRMNGVEFLKKLMPQLPTPVVMVSSLTERGAQVTLDALAAGAIDFVAKPKADVAQALSMMMTELRIKVKVAAVANVSHWKRSREEVKREFAKINYNVAAEKGYHDLIAIGASTGGTEAIASIMARLPPTLPGILIVQHMPKGFTKLFADRLNNLSDVQVREAVDGDVLKPGLCLIAPGGMQTEVQKQGGQFVVRTFEGHLVNGHMPSVEVMMRSAAKAAGARAIGVMLTGMGGDGAEGLKAMRDAGARTFAQSESTCVVFGMPKVAWEKGAAEELVDLGFVPDRILALLKGEK